MDFPNGFGYLRHLRKGTRCEPMTNTFADSFSHFSIYQSAYSFVVGEILAPKEISIFSCLTWFLMFAVVGEYFRLQENHIRDLADVWFLLPLVT